MITANRTIGIVGGGIVGLATALKIRQLLPDNPIILWEKERLLGRHQTTHNSGVLHAGLYYRPGSLKARLAVQGIRELTAFCRAQGVRHEICGKIVVAVDESEIARLNALLERGRANGLAGLALLSREELKEIEPHADGLAALRVPEEGIVDYGAVIRSLAMQADRLGIRIHIDCRVRELRREAGGWCVTTTRTEHRCGFLVNCAGLHSDRVAELASEPRSMRIVPFRGEYYQLRPDRRHLVRNLIYPVPDATFPFLGVHFTRMINGEVEAGPNAVLAFAREGYRKSTVNILDLADALFFPGLWRFFARHRDMCWDELRRSLSRRLFCASLQRLVPDVQESDLQPGGSGVRAQAMNPAGDLVQDFSLIERGDALHVLNAPSPAATACLAIGGEIATRVARQLRIPCANSSTAEL